MRYDYCPMHYDFDRVIERRNTHSIKWDAYPADVLPLWVADTDFTAPDEVLDAIHQRVDHGIFGYQSEMNELKNALVIWAESHYQWRILPEEILFVPGVVPGLNFAAHMLTKPGDGAIIQPPVYPPFFSIIKNSELRLQTAPLYVEPSRYHYEVNLDEFREVIDTSTRILILCNPHNPVGRVFTKKDLIQIAQICLEKNLVIFSDEIHCDLTYPGYQHIPIASLDSEIAQRVVTFMAPSKTFNIAGLKCSMIIVQNPELRKKLQNGYHRLIEEPNLLALVAGWAAYQFGENYRQELLNYLQGNRDLVVDYIKKRIPEIHITVPEATFLAWLDCRALNLSPSPYDFFLKHAKVALNDGQPFGVGGEGFVRLNFGCPRSVLLKALELMQASLNSR